MSYRLRHVGVPSLLGKKFGMSFPSTGFWDRVFGFYFVSKKIKINICEIWLSYFFDVELGWFSLLKLKWPSPWLNSAWLELLSLYLGGNVSPVDSLLRPSLDHWEFFWFPPTHTTFGARFLFTSEMVSNAEKLENLTWTY